MPSRLYNISALLLHGSFTCRRVGRVGIITSQIECLPAEPYLLARSAYRGSLVKRASRVIPGKDQRLSDDDDE